MSGSLTLMLPGNRREVVRTTPTTTLGAALAEVCGRPPRPLGDPDNFSLVVNKRELDLSTPVRFANLPNGKAIDVVRKQATTKPASAPAAPASVAAARSQHADSPVRAAAAVQPVVSDAVVAAESMAQPCEPAPAPSPLSEVAATLAGRPVAVYSRQALQAATESSGEVLHSIQDLPEEFYEMTAEDIMRLTAKRKEDEVLMTRAMREAAVAKRASVRGDLTKQRLESLLLTLSPRRSSHVRSSASSVPTAWSWRLPSGPWSRAPRCAQSWLPASTPPLHPPSTSSQRHPNASSRTGSKACMPPGSCPPPECTSASTGRDMQAHHCGLSCWL